MPRQQDDETLLLNAQGRPLVKRQQWVSSHSMSMPEIRVMYVPAPPSPPEIYAPPKDRGRRDRPRSYAQAQGWTRGYDWSRYGDGASFRRAF